jgi:hypothetical protein
MRRGALMLMGLILIMIVASISSIYLVRNSYTIHNSTRTYLSLQAELFLESYRTLTHQRILSSDDPKCYGSRFYEERLFEIEVIATPLSPTSCAQGETLTTQVGDAVMVDVIVRSHLLGYESLQLSHRNIVSLE